MCERRSNELILGRRAVLAVPRGAPLFWARRRYKRRLTSELAMWPIARGSEGIAAAPARNVRVLETHEVPGATPFAAPLVR